jgi:large subunit ribosomal protein L25
VPLHFTNEDKCVGVKIGGGSILKTLNEIEVSCLPKDLPEFIEVNMLEVEVGSNVHLSDIALPAGVTSVSLTHEDGDLAVATVKAAKGEKADKAADAEAEEAGEE